MKRIPIHYWLMGLIVVLAALIRLPTLGDAAFRADTMDFYRYAMAERSPLELLREQPWENQIPVAEAYMVWVIQTFNLPVTPWTVRFPIAFLGILAVWFMFKLGQTVFGTRLGLLAAFLVAINPFATAVSMEAYYYSGLICFAAFFFWRTCMLVHAMQEGVLRPKHWMWWGVAGALFCSTQMTAWSVFGVVWLFVCYHLWKSMRGQDMVRWLPGLLMCSLLVLAAIIPWIIKPIRLYLLGDTQPLGLEAAPWSNFFRILGETAPVYTFGKSWWGIAILILIILAGVVSAWLKPGEGHKGRLFAALAVCAFAGNLLLLLLMGKGQAKYTYFAAVFPLVMIGLAYLFDRIVDAVVSRWTSAAVYALPALAFLCVLYWGVPLHATMKMEGKPTAYRAIAEYVNANTPPGTLVLVDRWYEPWNELTLYPLEGGRQWTFTVPNEPAETARQMNWHRSVKQFFERHPNAVYLPLNDSYRGPDLGLWSLGPWDWPDDHFTHRVRLKHGAGLTLARWGVTPREDFYVKGPQSRLVINLHYNTVDDLIQRTRQIGKAGLVLFGGNWNHLKPWRPLQGWPEQLIQSLWIQAGSFMTRGTGFSDVHDMNRTPQPELMRFFQQGQWADYRVATPESSFTVHNVTDDTIEAELSVIAIALSGPISLRVAGRMVEFPQVLMVERTIPVTLSPGEQDILFTVRPNQLLLVWSAELRKL